MKLFSETLLQLVAHDEKQYMCAIDLLKKFESAQLKIKQLSMEINKLNDKIIMMKNDIEYTRGDEGK